MEKQLEEMSAIAALLCGAPRLVGWLLLLWTKWEDHVNIGSPECCFLAKDEQANSCGYASSSQISMPLWGAGSAPPCGSI